jgi:hypothetical protein
VETVQTTVVGVLTILAKTLVILVHLDITYSMIEAANAVIPSDLILPVQDFLFHKLNIATHHVQCIILGLINRRLEATILGLIHTI